MGWILLFAFWGSVTLLFINVGWKPAVTFIALWVLGLFVVLPFFGAPPVAGIVYQAVLTIPLVIWVKQVML